jgi:hypothetical protein
VSIIHIEGVDAKLAPVVLAHSKKGRPIIRIGSQDDQVFLAEAYLLHTLHHWCQPDAIQAELRAYV